jgi:hypothetical protein
MTAKPTINWDQIRQRKLMLAAPLYGNQLHFGFYQSVLNLALSCQRSGVSLGIKHVGCDSLVPRARNRLLAHFLDSKATDLIFIDADITFNSEDVFSLLALEEEIVGGIYPRKQLDWTRIAAAAKAGIPPDQLPYYGFIPVMNWVQAGEFPLDSLIEVRHLGTGFLRIRKSAIETMIEKLGESITFDYSSDEPQFINRVGHDLFPIGPDIRYPQGSGGRQYHSEDYGFCELAKISGFKLYAAPWIQLTHSGNMDYMGSLDVMDAAVEEALRATIETT